MSSLDEIAGLLQGDEPLLDSLPCAVSVCEAPSGTIRRYNRRAVEIWGREPRAGERFCAAEALLDLAGRPLSMSASPMARVLGTGKEHEAELMVQRTDGCRTIVHVRVVPLRDAKGQLAGAVSLFEDITERRQTEALLRGQKAALEAIARGEPLGKTLTFLARVVEERSFGRAIAGILLLDCEGKLRHGAAPSLPDAYNAAIDGIGAAPELGTCAQAAYKNEVVITPDLDKAASWASIKHLPLALGLVAAWSHPIRSSSGEVLGTFGTYFRERRSPTQEERQIVSLLAHTAAIAIERQRRDEAEAAANRRKDEFLAMLAHELRNPLAAIRGAGELLARQAESVRVEQAAGVISRQSATMAKLLDDLLDVSRITRGEIALAHEPVDLARIVRAAHQSLRDAGMGEGHHWTLRLPAHPVLVDGDAVRLEQVAANLLANAVRYTPPGGQIELEVQATSTHARLLVRDTGDGISPELLPRVFELFTRGPTPRRANPGLGVGLAVVRRLVELHAGSVRAASEGAGRGAEFVVELPLSGMKERAAPSPARAVAAARRVLIVEDQDDVADMLSALLKLDGHTVSVARDGIAGLELIRELQPEVALVDIGLPRLNGYELVRQARADGGLGRTVFVALTGYGSTSDVALALASGFDHHLVKPVDAEQLARVLSAKR